MLHVLDQAHTAAHQQAKQWIRSVFQQVHCSLWRDHGHVEPGKETASPQQIHISQDMIVEAQAMCRRVSQQWCQRLQARGHYEFARWVRQVWDTERESFFAGNSEQEQEQQNDDDASHEEDLDVAASQPEPWKATTTLLETNEATISIPNAVCPLAALRQLELPTHDPSMTQTQREEYVIRQMDAMGHAQKTYWPLDWKIIQEAAHNIPKRLHRNQGQKFQLTLVPKAEANNDDDNHMTTLQQQQQQVQEPDHPTMPPPAPNGTTTTSSLEQMLVDHQRQNFYFKKRKSNNHNHQGNASHANHPKRPKICWDDTPRPPMSSSDHPVGIPWNDTVAQELLACDSSLDAYLRPTLETNIPHTLLGALKPMGHVHHAIQIRHDYDPQDLASLADQTLVRKYSRSIKERMGPLLPEKVIKANKVKSKIRRSIMDGADDDDDDDDDDAPKTTRRGIRHYVDLDLGECMLDLEDEENSDAGLPIAAEGEERAPSRKLYSFSSLEVSLLDENEPDDDGH